MVANNQQHIFYRGFHQLIGPPGNPIIHVVWDPSSGLHNEIWAGSGSPTNAPPAAGDPATMVANNQQHIFYRDTAGNIQHVLWDPSSGQHLEQWAGGSGSSTTGPAAVGDPATMVWNSQQHIFYRDLAGNIQHVVWDPNSGRHVEQWAGPGPNGVGNFGEFFLINYTQGWSTGLQLDLGYGTTTAQTAEWIMERPCSDGSLSGLVNFGTAQFTGANAFSRDSDIECCDASSTRVDMTSNGQSDGSLLSSASSPNATTVDLTWHASYGLPPIVLRGVLRVNFATFVRRLGCGPLTKRVSQRGYAFRHGANFLTCLHVTLANK
jgi:hypothetical protein